MKYKEVYDIAMPISKRESEKYNYWVRYVIRPLSVLLTIPLISTKVKPIKVTLISVYSSLIGAFLLAFGQSMITSIIGWFFFFMWAILDGVDGNLARCQKTCSQLGELWDAFGGYATLTLIFLSTGIAAYYDNNLIEVGNKYWYLIIGGTTSTISIFPRLIYQKKMAIGGITNAKSSITGNGGILRIIQCNLAISGGMQVLLLLSIVCHCLNVFIILYFVFYLCMMIMALKKLLR